MASMELSARVMKSRLMRFWLASCIALFAAIFILMPRVTGCGTMLFLMTGLISAEIVQRITHSCCTEGGYFILVRLLIALMNLSIYALATAVMIDVLKKRAAVAGLAVIIAFVLYLSCYFWLFPAQEC